MQGAILTSLRSCVTRDHNALGSEHNALGRALGSVHDALGKLRNALGRALGTAHNALGRALCTAHKALCNALVTCEITRSRSVSRYNLMHGRCGGGRSAWRGTATVRARGEDEGRRFEGDGGGVLDRPRRLRRARLGERGRVLDQSPEPTGARTGE